MIDYKAGSSDFYIVYQVRLTAPKRLNCFCRSCKVYLINVFLLPVPRPAPQPNFRFAGRQPVHRVPVLGLSRELHPGAAVVLCAHQLRRRRFGEQPNSPDMTQNLQTSAAVTKRGDANE